MQMQLNNEDCNEGSGFCNKTGKILKNYFPNKSMSEFL